EPARRHEEREEGRFEQQVVPLEGEEILADRDEGEIHEPARRERDPRSDVADEPAAEDRASHGGDPQRAVTSIDPEQSRYREEGVCPGEVLTGGKQPLAPEEERRLDEQRKEGGEEEETEQAEEEVAGMRAEGRLAGLMETAGLLVAHRAP